MNQIKYVRLQAINNNGYFPFLYLRFWFPNEHQISFIYLQLSGLNFRSAPYISAPVAQLVSAWYLYDSIHPKLTGMLRCYEDMPRSRVRASPVAVYCIFKCLGMNKNKRHVIQLRFRIINFMATKILSYC